MSAGRLWGKLVCMSTQEQNGCAYETSQGFDNLKKKNLVQKKATVLIPNLTNFLVCPSSY